MAAAPIVRLGSHIALCLSQPKERRGAGLASPWGSAFQKMPVSHFVPVC